MKRKREVKSRIKKQVTTMRKAVDKSTAAKAYYDEVKDKNKRQGKPEDDINAHARAIKNTSKKYAENKVKKGGEKAALSFIQKTGKAGKVVFKGGVYGVYAAKDYKRKELVRKIKDYIYANGTIKGSGFEEKFKTLYVHEQKELENLIKEVNLNNKNKQEFVSKAEFNTIKKQIKEKGAIQDKQLKIKANSLNKNKQQKIKQISKKYKVLSQGKNKTAQKAMLKKKAIADYKAIKRVDKGTKGIAAFIKALGGAVKAIAVSSTLPFIIGAIAVLTAIAIIVPSFVTVQKQMSTQQQIIEIAQREIGTIGGDKYRTWYTGHADGEMWCATFVSWCADKCGLIDQGVFPKFQGCDAGLEWFKQQGLFDYTPQYDGVEYIPKMGDIIFFTGRGGVYDKYDSTHVGFVQGVENGQVLTIEGNTSNAVLPRRYSLNNQRILGYARPQYPMSLSGYGQADFSGSNTGEIVWNFLKSMGCSDEAAAGIMGNIQGESSMNPGAIESNGEGHGLCQWSFGRKLRLFERAAEVNKPWQDIEVQLVLLWDEINGLDAATKNILDANYGGVEGFKNMTSIERATEAFCLAFERPSHGSTRVRQRIPYAKRYYELYANK